MVKGGYPDSKTPRHPETGDRQERLKGKREYRGVLDGYDPHMNLVLKNAEELVSGESVGRTATIIVRGDNVIYISP